MIELNPKLCEELDLTYWQLNQEDSTTIHHTINREEKELLRKILLAKGITLTDDIFEVQEDGIVVVFTNGYQLIFNDVKIQDTDKTTHLAKISDMLNSAEYKKHTWYKLKNLDF